MSELALLDDELIESFNRAESEATESGRTSPNVAIRESSKAELTAASAKIKAELKPEPELIGTLGKYLPETQKNWPDFLVVSSSDPEINLDTYIEKKTGHKPINLSIPFLGKVTLVHPDGIPPLEALCKLHYVKPAAAIRAERRADSIIKRWLDRLEANYGTGARQEFFHAPQRAARLP